MTPEVQKPLRVFCSYSRRDEELLNELRVSLSGLVRQGLIEWWHDREIVPGSAWEEAIDKHLRTADLILLLVSPDFMNSEYVYDQELNKAIERHERGEARVIPIIVRPTDWELSVFSKLQALPRDAKPITTWPDRDEAWFNVARGIRLVFEELRQRGTTQVVETETALEFLQLVQVFKPSGVPTVTFVEPDHFPLLKLALAQPGRGVVIEGPSGIGKTTALQKAISQLHSDIQLTDVTILSARRPDDVQRLATIEEWHRGIVALDDFHRLSVQLREAMTDYLKYLADYEFEDRKLVIVGIPETGRRLVELSFDVATRIEICKLGRVEDQTVLRMIEKGEKALNILFDRRTDIVRAAAGSLNIAQLLCYQVAAREGVLKTELTTKELNTDLEAATSQVMQQMSLKFDDVVRSFASLGGAQDRTGVELLRELASTEEGVLSLYSLKAARPELAAGIDHFLSSGFMDTLYNRFPVSRNHLLLDEIRPALVIDDPQLTFFLAHTPASKLIRSTGKRPNTLRNKVFVSYSHADTQWLDRLRVHLKPVERIGEIELWDDTQIEPGARWRQEIEEALDTAKAAVLLVSANFLASDFIAENELPPLLAAAERRGTMVLPVILSPSLFDDTELAQFQAVNAPTKPLLSMTRAEQEDVLVRVAQTLRGALSAS